MVFCIYIGRKRFGLWLRLGVCDGWKCWFSWGFTILGTIFGFWWINWWNAWFYLVDGVFWLVVWFLSWYGDELAYTRNEKQNTCFGFCYPPSQKLGFFPFYRKSNICLYLSDLLKLEYLQVLLKTMCNSVLYHNISF